MSFPIDQSLSLLIPRVFPQWTDEQVIIDIFHQQRIGRVYKVNVIRVPDSKKRSYPIYQAFVYFTAWYDTEIAYNFQQRIYGPKQQARVVYDDPWYWVAFENKKRGLSNNDKRLIRIGYQAYVNDNRIEDLTDRICALETLKTPVISAVDAWQTTESWPIADSWSEVPTMQEPKAKSLLNANAVPFAPPVKAKAKAKAEARLSFKNLSEAFVMNRLGAELNLTETAMSVAEAALMETDEEREAELNLTETAWNAAERALMETDEEQEAELNLTETARSVAEHALQEHESEDDEFYREDYYDY